MRPDYFEAAYAADDFFDYAARGTKSLYRRKPQRADTAYHVFNRRGDKAAVFLDDRDRGKFLDIAKRLLRPQDFRDNRGRPTKRQQGHVTLLAYCVLENHYHLVLHQDRPYAISVFMRSLMSAYARYFNRRHGRSGRLFDERFQAKPITSTRHLKIAIAYVHANPKSPLDYAWTGHGYYIDATLRRGSCWIDASAGLRVYGSRAAYTEWFLRAAEARKRRLTSKR